MRIKFVTLVLVSILVSCQNDQDKQVEIIDSNAEEVIDVKQIPDGDFTENFLNGNLKIKGKMLNNKRDGLWIAYYENGIKQSESTYLNGTLHGRTASFYKNGQVRYIGYFLGGKKDGKWQFYSESGDFDKNEMYVKGVLSK